MIDGTLSKSIAPVYLAPHSTFGASALYGGQFALEGRRSMDTEGGGVQATADNGGRGVLVVSNKPSEHNILNIPIVIVTNQLPGPQRAQQTRRVVSKTIPNMALPVAPNPAVRLS